MNFFTFLWALMLVSLAFITLLFVRNNWVFKQRTKLIRTPDYDRLPTYEEMLRRWWVWDIKKFLR